MKALITILILAGLASAQIFGPGGVPVDWRDLGIEWMESSKFTTAGATNYLTMTSSAAADTLLWTMTGAPGDRDMVIAMVDESGNKRVLFWNDADSRWETAAPIVSTSAAIGLRATLGGIRVNTMVEAGNGRIFMNTDFAATSWLATLASTPTLRIDPNEAGAGTTQIGVVGDADSLAVIGNASFSGTVDVAGTIDADSLALVGGATVGGNLAVTGTVDADSLDLAGGALIGGSLGVTTTIDADSLDLAGGALIGGSLGVTTTIDADSLDLVGGALIGGSLGVTTTIDADSLALVSGALIGGTVDADSLDLVGGADIGGALNVTTTIDADSLDLAGGALIGGSLGVTTTIDADSLALVAGMTAGGTVNADSLALVAGATIGGSLDVTATIDADSLALVGGAVIGGDLTVVGAGDDIVVGAYTRRVCIEAGGATLGPTAPSWDETATVGGLGFDAAAENVHLRFSVPYDWDGVSDMTFNISWMAESGDAFADTETLIWLIAYRSLAWGTEVADNGTVVNDSVTDTQAGAGTDKATFISTITIDYDHAHQPLTAGDCLVIEFKRDTVTDTYSGKGIVLGWALTYTSTGLAR